MTEQWIVVIRYDEIALKGKNRRFFETCLLNNIRAALAGLEGLRFRVPRGRILIDTDQRRAEECARRLPKVPGISSFSVGIPVAPEVEDMARLGIERVEPHLTEGQTLRFCVQTHRRDKAYPMTSTEINHAVGSRIMGALAQKGLTVDIKNADRVIEIELDRQETVLFDQRVPGIPGLPVGSSGEVLSLLSGGIDSPVASYLMMARGCRVHFIFFDNRTFLGRGGHDKVVKLARILNGYQQKSRLFVVPFQDMQVAIRDACTPANRVVLYRRMMYRIARSIAETNRYLGLVTGESLGQVASQTLENLAAVSSVVPMSVFRPLIGMEKQEIIARAKKIGTFETSIEPQPDCCSVFMPDRPVTKSREDVLARDESRFPWSELAEKAIAATEMVELDASH